MNKVQEIGRVTKEIEVKATPSGKSVVQFTIAVPRFRREDGADFLTCVAWNKTAENMGKYVRKGDRIAVSGRLQSRSYEAKGGHKVYVTEIIAEEVEFLEYKHKDDEQPQEEQPQTDANGFTDINPDDLPF